MNDDNNYNPQAPLLDDIDYSEPKTKKDDPQNVSAPILDDIDYVAPSSHKGGPQNVTAPILDDMDSYVPPTEKKGAPTNVTAPTLDDDYSYSAPKPAMTEEEEIIAGMTAEQKTMYENLPADKQKQVIEMRKAQLAQKKAEEAPIAAPVLDDDNYIPPPKKEKAPEPAAPVSAPILDDEPAPTKYVPKFVDEDLERAKKEGAKKAVSSQLVSNQKDEKESLRMMLELKAEREAEAAKKGFISVIVVAVIGVIGAVLFYMLYSCQFFGFEYSDSGNKFFGILKNYSLYAAAVAGVLSLTLMTGIGGLKSLCSFYQLIFSAVQLFALFTLVPQISGSGVKWVLAVAALALSIAVLIVPSASENIGFFYKSKKPRKEYDH